jgi:hypothetical protein
MRKGSNNLLQSLRSRIVSGELCPGDRLPTRREIQRRYNASPDTTQRAFDRLTREGFVVSRGRAGTFVSSNPPHLSHYAIACGYVPASGRGWSRFVSAIASQAMTAETSPGDRRFSMYWGIDGRDDIEDYRRLIADARANRIAGVIFTSAVFGLRESSLLEEAPVPMVAMQTQPPRTDEVHPADAIPSVYPDGSAFLEQAMRHLHAQGRRRVAVLAHGLTQSMQASITRHAEASGMECPARHVQAPSLGNPLAIRHALELIFSGNARPDGLILADDHLVPDATRALVDLSLRTPDDLDVVAHCNSPALTEAAVPVTRLGFAAGDVLSACVDAIDRTRRGETPEPMQWIAPRFFHHQRAMPPLHVAFPSIIGEGPAHAGALASSFELNAHRI